MKTKIIICILVLLLNASCNLDMEPLGSANGEQMWGTSQGSEQMLSGSYARLRKILISDRPMYLYGDLPSNVLFKHNHWIANYATEGNYVGAYLADWWLDWSPYFQVITTTNTLLKHINDVPLSDFGSDMDDASKKRDRIRGEAYFLYSFTYFYMVRIYGDLPLVKEAFESANQGLEEGSTIPRKQSPEKEILEYLLKTVDASITLLDFDKPGDQNWAVRADKAAALTLKAHILLWLAKDAGKGSADFIKYITEAEKALDIVINQSNRSLVSYDNRANVENMFDGKSSEGIFELNVSVENNESFHINYGEFPLHVTTYRDVSRQTLSNLNSFMVPEPSKATNLYPVNDKRRSLFFQNFGNSVGDYLAPPFLLKYAAHLEDDASVPGRYFTNSNVLLFRLSECILLRAEALAKLGRTGNARTMLNMIRTRAGIGNYMGSDADLIKAIFEERARELAGEGHSAYDRIRNDYWDGNDFMTTERKVLKGYYWPMDIRNLISANPDLYQVPYWKGKL